MFTPRERKLLSYVLVKAKLGEDLKALAERLSRTTGQAAYTQEEFKRRTMRYFMRNTGIPINFGMAVGLGFLLGTAIAGQTFYNFTVGNLQHFAACKAMGASHDMLIGMILSQALMVGSIGYGLGVGAVSLFGYLLGGDALAFKLSWQLYLLTASAITLICICSALMSIRKVLSLEPAIVFQG